MTKAAQPERPVRIRPFGAADAREVRELFIAVNRLLAPPDRREAFEAYIARASLRRWIASQTTTRNTTAGFGLPSRKTAWPGSLASNARPGKRWSFAACMLRPPYGDE